MFAVEFAPDVGRVRVTFGQRNGGRVAYVLSPDDARRLGLAVIGAAAVVEAYQQQEARIVAPEAAT